MRLFTVLGIVLGLASPSVAIELEPNRNATTNSSFITPTITSPTVVGTITGPIITNEATVDPDVYPNKMGLGNCADGSGDVDGLWISQAAAGDTFCIGTNANGVFNLLLGDRANANSLSVAMSGDADGSISIGSPGTGAGGGGGTTPGFRLDNSASLTKVGIFDTSPTGMFSIKALPFATPTTFLLHVSSQNESALLTLDVDGNVRAANDLHVQDTITAIGTTTLVGNAALNGTSNIIGLGGTPLAVISTGTYAGADTANSNLDSATPGTLFFTRIGNIVDISGSFNADPTTTLTTTSFELNIPVASNFTTDEDAAGVGANAINESVACSSSATNDTLVFTWKPAGTANVGHRFKCAYVIK